MSSINPKSIKISDSLHPSKTNRIIKFYLSRINRKESVMEFTHVKIDKIFSKFGFFAIKLNHIILATSDQHLMIYDLLDLP